MADEQNGKFTEVYDLALNTEKFLDALKKVISELKKFSNDLNKTVGDAGGKALEAITDKAVVENKKRVKNAEETAKQLVAIEKRKLAEMRAALSGNELNSRGQIIDPNTGRFVKIGPDISSAQLKRNNSALKTARDINIEQVGVASNSLDEMLKEDIRNKDLLRKQQEQFDKESILAQEKVAAAKLAADKAYHFKKLAEDRAQRKLQLERQEQEGKDYLASQAKLNAPRIFIENKAKQEAMDDLRAFYRQQDEAGKQAYAAQRSALAKQLAEENRLRKQAAAEAVKIAKAAQAEYDKNQKSLSQTGAFLPGGAPSFYQSNRALGPGGAPVREKLPSPEKLEGDFLSKVFKGFANSAAVALRYSIIFATIQTAVDALSAAVLAPFIALQNGVQYLRELESQAIELTGVLNSNVEFSKDFSENLKLSAAAAKEVQRALEDVAAETGVNVERLQAVFKFFITNGGAALVKTTKEAVDFAKLYTVVIESAGLQSLQLASETAKIGELLQDDKFNNPIFLKALSLTATEWIKIRTEAGKTKDLYQTLEKLAKPQLDAIKDSAVQQTRVVKQVELLINRIQALGALGVYQKITEFLRYVAEWLKENEADLVRIFKTFGDSVTNVVTSLGQLGIPDAFLAALKVVALNAQFISITFERLIDTLQFLSSVSSSLVTNIDNPDKLTSEMSKSISQFEALNKKFKTQTDEYNRNRRLLFPSDAEVTINGVTYKSKASEKSLGNSLLDADISNKNPSNRDPSQAGVAGAALNSELKGIDLARKAIKEALDDYRNTVREKQSELLLDKTEVAAKIQAANKQELRLEKELLDQSLDLIDRELAAAKVGTTNKEQLATLEENYQNKRYEVKARFYEAERQLNKASSQVEREAARERVAIQRETIDRIRDVQKAGIESLIKEVKVGEEIGRFTRLEAFDQETELQRRRLEIDRDTAKDEVESIKATVVQKIRAQSEYEQALAKLSKLDSQRANERISVEQQQAQAFRSAAIERLSILNTENEIQQKIVESITGIANFSAQDQLLKNRREELNLLIQQKAEQIDLIRLNRDASKSEVEAVVKLKNELASLQSERLANVAARISLTDNLPDGVIRNILRRSQLKEEQEALASVVSSRISSSPNFSQDPEFLKASGALRRNQEQQDALRRNNVAQTIGKKSFEQITGINFDQFREALEAANSPLEKLAVTSNALVGVLSTVGSALSVFSQGKEQGGLLGGIGGLASQFGDLAGPVFGPIVKAFGGVASLIGNIFVAATKRIVEDVNRKFDDTLTEFNRGNLGLADTIDALNRQRVDAINRLSGKKNGKDELKKILEQFDDQIYTLEAQQKEIIKNFNEEVRLLSLNSEYLSTIENQWAEINEKVKEYLRAGGQANVAAEYLSAQLGRIKQQAIDELSDAEQEAIQNVIQLNTLLEQRNQLVEDFKKKEFDLINANSIERRGTGSVTRGRELEELRKQNAKNLEDLDSQIKLQTIRVDKEREIFRLSTDLADLRRRDEELSLLALDKQIAKLRELQSVVSSIVSGPNGFIGSGIFGQSTTNITVTVTPNFGDNPQDIGREIANSLSAELGRRQRLAMA